MRRLTRRSRTPAGLHPYGDMHQRKRGGRHAGDAAGLTDGAGTNPLQLLLHLAGETADGLIFEPFGNGDGFGSFQLLNGLLLLVEIPGKLELGLDGTRCARQVLAS